MSSEQDPILTDDDLSDIFDSLPTPAGASQQKAKHDKESADISYLAARAMGEWHACRRVLYIYQRKCAHCHTTHAMPSDRVLTEYQHSDGTRKHATEAKPDAGLPMETETLTGRPLEACQYCFNTGRRDQDDID